MTSKIRLGAVSFLNAKPLVFGLEAGLGRDRIELSYDVPSMLAAKLSRGDLDGALLPSIELARIPGLVVLPGLSISSRGPAASVVLISTRPPDQARRVALDPDSRTTNTLVPILYDRVWHASPSFVAGPNALDDALRDADAAVRIGDKALFESRPPGVTVTDLGEAWTAWTGGPFVYAVWALREDVADREVYEILHASRRQGRLAVDRIAAEYAKSQGRDPARASDYLTHNMLYRLGAEELEAIRTFLAEAARLSLTAGSEPVRLASFGGATCGVGAAR